MTCTLLREFLFAVNAPNKPVPLSAQSWVTRMEPFWKFLFLHDVWSWVWQSRLQTRVVLFEVRGEQRVSWGQNHFQGGPLYVNHIDMRKARLALRLTSTLQNLQKSSRFFANFSWYIQTSVCWKMPEISAEKALQLEVEELLCSELSLPKSFHPKTRAFLFLSLLTTDFIAWLHIATFWSEANPSGTKIYIWNRKYCGTFAKRFHVVEKGSRLSATCRVSCIRMFSFRTIDQINHWRLAPTAHDWHLIPNKLLC